MVLMVSEKKVVERNDAKKMLEAYQHQIERIRLRIHGHEEYIKNLLHKVRKRRKLIRSCQSQVDNYRKEMNELREANQDGRENTEGTNTSVGGEDEPERADVLEAQDSGGVDEQL